jgi:hypothetical protein
MPGTSRAVRLQQASYPAPNCDRSGRSSACMRAISGGRMAAVGSPPAAERYASLQPNELIGNPSMIARPSG